MKLSYALPLFLFIGIALILWRGLSLHPQQVPSPLINKQAPNFNLPELISGATTNNNDFQGHVTLVNVWATWCYACAEEHEFLLKLSQDTNLYIYGFNYKDDVEKAKTWLHEHGNPYKKIAVDKIGSVCIDWGVYGTPETFVLDKHGIIRYKHIGPITDSNWSQILKPIIEKWQAAT
jgi:cytochrome c biogenesis protein CcmG, thiol:disulfide interchange protein DsbE